MWGYRISLIYFYLISTISIILLVIGVYHVVTFTVNTIVYDKYPLNWAGDESRCEVNPWNAYGKPLPEPVGSVAREATPSAQELEKQKQLCLTGLEKERKQHQVNDLKNAITFMLVGSALFALHFPIALKRSREKE